MAPPSMFDKLELALLLQKLEVLTFKFAYFAKRAPPWLDDAFPENEVLVIFKVGCTSLLFTAHAYTAPPVAP
jgi:hypothetical protein